MNKQLIELFKRAREVLLKKALISSEVTRDIAVDALFNFADSGDFLSLIKCAEAAEWRSAVEHEAACNLVVELSAANKRIAELETNTTKAIRAVISERQHQQNQGRGDAHDDGYIDGVLALGGAAYAISGAGFNCIGTYRRRAKNLWPFPLETFNPTGNENRRNDLVRGAAMIIAEIDRIDRRAARAECATTSVQDTGVGWMEKIKPGHAE